MKYAAKAVVDGARLRIRLLVDTQVRNVIDHTMNEKRSKTRRLLVGKKC